MLLPAELVDHIFSFLRGDIPTLNACSNTHPSFSSLAERYLYADIVVGTKNDVLAYKLYKAFCKNPRILEYPRTLEIHANTDHRPQGLPIIVSMIPRMANLTSLKLCETRCFNQGFLSTLFEKCLQQSSVEQIHLFRLHNFPLSILNNVKTLKKLMLFNCTVMTGPTSNSAHQLETLIICELCDSNLLTQIIGRVANLKSFYLQHAIIDSDGWNVVSELVAACSDSLTKLHLDVGYNRHTQSTYDPGFTGDRWIHHDLEFPFTLSTHKRLKHLSIFAPVISVGNPIVTMVSSALPAIMNLIKMAPAVQDVVLHLHWEDGHYSAPGIMDWSLLDFDYPGIHPRIHLFISGDVSGDPISPESILEVVTENETLMDLVKRKVVILKPVRRQTTKNSSSLSRRLTALSA